MSAGYPVTRASLDNQMGLLVVTAKQALLACNSFKTQKLDTTQFSDTVLGTLGYAAGDITLIRNSFTDLSNLYLTATGQRVQSPASNFFFTADGLSGSVLS